MLSTLKLYNFLADPYLLKFSALRFFMSASFKNLSNKKSLNDTLKDGLKDLDGFYTFITGTRKGFAVLRDEIACKPAVIAETDDYVAIASEFQAMAHLPNVNNAKIFEPEPGVVYSWGN